MSAEGELPFPARPGDSGRYVDLEGPDAAFATIDYGDGSGTPKFFVGRQVDPTQVEIVRTAVGPRSEEKVDLGKLKCPSCGGSRRMDASWLPSRTSHVTFSPNACAQRASPSGASTVLPGAGDLFRFAAGSAGTFSFSRFIFSSSHSMRCSAVRGASPPPARPPAAGTCTQDDKDEETTQHPPAKKKKKKMASTQKQKGVWQMLGDGPHPSDQQEM